MLLPLVLVTSSLAGPINQDALDTAMAAAQTEARACHAKAVERDWRLAGEIVVQASVGPAGRVSGAKVARSSVTDPELVGCVLSAVDAQTVERPGGGGFTPITHAFVLWNPPADAKPVKPNKAERLVNGATGALSACLESVPDAPGRLDLDLLVLGRRVHPVTGALPPEWARCVSGAFASARAPGAGLVHAKIVFDAEGQATVEKVIPPGGAPPGDAEG